MLESGSGPTFRDWRPGVHGLACAGVVLRTSIGDVIRYAIRDPSFKMEMSVRSDEDRFYAPTYRDVHLEIRLSGLAIDIPTPPL